MNHKLKFQVVNFLGKIININIISCTQVHFKQKSL